MLKLNGITTSKQRVGNGVLINPTGTRDGALYTADWLQGLAMEGRVFTASLGTVSTPITFKAYDADRPEFSVDVPSGTTIIPIHIDVYIENSAGTDNEILAVTSTCAVGAGTSTAITPLSTRTDRPVTTGCSVYGAYSGDGTTPTGTIEFWRTGDAFADAATKPSRLFSWDIREGAPQVIVGAGALVLYISATTTQMDGFVKVTWAEIPSSGI